MPVVTSRYTLGTTAWITPLEGAPARTMPAVPSTSPWSFGTCPVRPSTGPRDKGLRTGICFPSQWWFARLSRDEAPWRKSARFHGGVMLLLDSSHASPKGSTPILPITERPSLSPPSFTRRSIGVPFDCAQGRLLRLAFPPELVKGGRPTGLPSSSQVPFLRGLACFRHVYTKFSRLLPAVWLVPDCLSITTTSGYRGSHPLHLAGSV